jgi:aerobic carbon-monoxide dehydrogenase medium subunit
VKPAQFEYIKAATIEDAVRALGQHGDRARILAGGQSLIPMMNFRLITPEVLIDIGNIKTLSFIRREGDALVIGAGTTHTEILKSADVKKACPLLTEAYGHVAHHTIRNRGTIGGNICHHDPASEVPLVLTLLDATLTLVGPNGSREVPAAEFFVGMMETAAASDELLTEIRIPAQPDGEGFAFAEVSTRKGDYAIVAAACRLNVRGGSFTDVKLGFVGAGAHIKRIPEAEAALENQPASDQSIENAVAEAAKRAQPDEDVQADVAYKLDLVRTLGSRVLRTAHGRATAGTP